MSEALTKEGILGSDDLPREQVEVPEWGGHLWVKALTGQERDRYETSVVKVKGTQQVFNMENVRARLASLTICDEKGVRLFSEADIKELGKKSAAALSRVFNVAQSLSGITKKDVEELTEALEDNPFDSSASGSP